MKSAAVIGDEFGTEALQRIMPLRHENNASLTQILKELEVNGLIEILDESSNILNNKQMYQTDTTTLNTNTRQKPNFIFILSIHINMIGFITYDSPHQL